MAEYTQNELVDMDLCYAVDQANYATAVPLYQERFPNCRQLSVSVLRRIIQRFHDRKCIATVRFKKTTDSN